MTLRWIERVLLALMFLGACGCTSAPPFDDGRLRLWSFGTVYAVYDTQTRVITITDQGKAVGVSCK